MEANYFTILYWFCHTSTWICHRYTRVPHPEPLPLLPSRTIPLGHPSAPAPSIQYHALNLDWRFISYVILYMFQCHSPISFWITCKTLIMKRHHHLALGLKLFVSFFKPWYVKNLLFVLCIYIIYNINICIFVPLYNFIFSPLSSMNVHLYILW